MLFVCCEKLWCVQTSASLLQLHKYGLITHPPSSVLWMFRGVVCLAGVNRVLLKPLTRPPARCSGCVWSSAVNHRFDFAYLEDAVIRANSTTTTTTLCLPLSSPLPPSLLPYTYQLLRSLLILSLPCLYLAVRTKPKPARPPHSINGISAASLFLFFLLHMSTGFFFIYSLLALTLFERFPICSICIPPENKDEIYIWETADPVYINL